ncbi:MAG: hypothetical protein ACR2IE_15645 [Candidatus Sumerlaeaceae bacterium]
MQLVEALEEVGGLEFSDGFDVGLLLQINVLPARLDRAVVM